MFSRISRKAIATLIVAAALALSCAAPSQALWSQSRRGAEEPTQRETGRHFLPFSLPFLDHLFELIGGALDPNGAH